MGCGTVGIAALGGGVNVGDGTAGLAVSWGGAKVGGGTAAFAGPGGGVKVGGTGAGAAALGAGAAGGGRFVEGNGPEPAGRKGPPNGMGLRSSSSKSSPSGTEEAN